MATELSAAVVGVGRLGSLHADKYRQLPGVRLAYVVDPDPARAAAVAERTGARAISDWRELAGKVQMASVASPSLTHFDIASGLLELGIDVLLEKPMAASPAQARRLAELAQQHGRVLQIGHLERFNPAVAGLRPLLHAPRFVECHRLAPFTERGTDVDVILDLMVHDLDVVLTATEAGVSAVEAIGVAVLTDRIDVANARLRFADGMIANLNTSRVAARRERKIRFFQHDAYISLDYEARTIQVYRRLPPPAGQSYPTITAERIELKEGDPLADEVASFCLSVRDRTPPKVSAQDGLKVIELCTRIAEAIAAGNP